MVAQLVLADEGLGAGGVVIYLAIVVLMIAGMWATFAKAGKPGWAAIIPIYNTCVMAEVAGKEWWWGLLPLIPFAGIIFMILLEIGVAKRFGKGGGFVVGMIFLPFIFWPILGFGGAQYQSAATAA